ncbi:dienelactone hydrolase [Pararhizobium polonicum]|uniref:Dienelactone hydrolase n=2 Tax=Pararhizobium polonicum TaxID=1612624 RepID=A0A1C7P717_9HYPH|nr:dienelactone hydrolase [Pararhizobium polonicum]
MRIVFAIALALSLLVLCTDGQAASREQIIVRTPAGDVLVESLTDGVGKARPAVMILSGSKGFGAPAYEEIGRTFRAAGLDTYLVHVLSPADLKSIAGAGNARGRIQYYAKRMPDWIATVRAVVTYLNGQPRHAGRVGVLGISLGAQIAAAASIDRADIGALLLVDGGFPNDEPQRVRSLPPLSLIWGGADTIFPPSIGRKLQTLALGLGGPASLDIYEGAAHDFFLNLAARQARMAHTRAADFFVSQLLRNP